MNSLQQFSSPFNGTRNYAEQTINVYAQEIYVDGKKVSDYMLIGEFEPDECDYGRFTLPQISPASSYTIRAFVEIDDEDIDPIDRGEVFEISVNFEDATLSAKSCAEEEAERRRLEEERRKDENQRRIEEERRKAEEQRRLEDERRRVEEQRRHEQELARRKDYYRTQELCQHCGGKFKGLFKKVCSNCGRSKDY